MKVLGFVIANIQEINDLDAFGKHNFSGTFDSWMGVIAQSHDGGIASKQFESVCRPVHADMLHRDSFPDPDGDQRVSSEFWATHLVNLANDQRGCRACRACLDRRLFTLDNGGIGLARGNAWVQEETLYAYSWGLKRQCFSV